MSSTFKELVSKRTKQVAEKRGILSVLQGTIKGKLKPENMPGNTIIVLDVGDNYEHRVLVSSSIAEQITELEEIEMVQCVGMYDGSFRLVIAFDVVVLTKDKEIVFQVQ